MGPPELKPTARSYPVNRFSTVHDRQCPLDPGGVVPADPGDPRVLAEPRVLAPREPPGAGHRGRERLVLRDGPVEERQQLLVAERPVGRAALAQAGSGQPPYLLDQ